MNRRCFFLLAALLFFALAPAGAMTSYSTLAGRLADLATRSSLISLYDIGRASSGSRSLWLVKVADPRVDPRATVRILILCRQHGDEPAGTEAALGLLERIAAGTAPGAGDALKHATLFLIPEVNPDGADALTRLNGRGQDLNRDWGRFDAVETAEVYRAFNAIRPAFVLDVHSWDRSDPFRENCLEAGRSESRVDQASRAVQERAITDVGSGTGQGILQTTYGRGVDYSLCHRFMSESAGVPALLFETAPGDKEGADFTRRVDLARAMMLWTLRDTSAHPLLWRRMARLSSAGRAAPTFALDNAPSQPSASSAVASAKSVAPFIPRTVLWAFGAYALAAALVCIYRPKFQEPGIMRVERAMNVEGRKIARSVYIPSGVVTRPVLTRPVKRWFG